MQKKTGFTIIELLIVVIIIGVLATIAVPQFTKAVEKTKLSKGMNMLGLMKKAQAMYYAENDSYANVTGAGDVDRLTEYVDAIVAADKDWTYNCTGTESMYSCSATRDGGTYDDCEVFNSYSTADEVDTWGNGTDECVKDISKI